MEFFSSITADITLNWGKNKNSKKWRSLVESKYGDTVGAFLRESTASLDGDRYYFYVFEKAVFAIKESSQTSGQITHFGLGDYSNGPSRLKWTVSSKDISNQVGTLNPLGSITSIKQLMKDQPESEPSEEEETSYKDLPEDVVWLPKKFIPFFNELSKPFTVEETKGYSGVKKYKILLNGKLITSPTGYESPIGIITTNKNSNDYSVEFKKPFYIKTYAPEDLDKAIKDLKEGYKALQPYYNRGKISTLDISSGDTQKPSGASVTGVYSTKYPDVSLYVETNSNDKGINSIHVLKGNKNIGALFTKTVDDKLAWAYGKYTKGYPKMYMNGKDYAVSHTDIEEAAKLAADSSLFKPK